MDWLRQVPIGQYVDGSRGWLRRLDPRLKLAWSLVFLLTPVLAGPLWRVALVVALVVITFGSGLARSLWWRPVLLLTALALVVGLLSMLLAVDPPAAFPLRNPAELGARDGRASGICCASDPAVGRSQACPLRWIGLGAAGVDSTLIFTVIHSEFDADHNPSGGSGLGSAWCLAPLKWLGCPVERLGFQPCWRRFCLSFRKSSRIF